MRDVWSDVAWPKQAGPEFTDGFSKLQHGQPPIIETMVLVPGVLLEQMGKVKARPKLHHSPLRQSGPEPDSRYMSRKEYVQLAEAEVPIEASVRKGAAIEPKTPEPPKSADTAEAGVWRCVADGSRPRAFHRSKEAGRG